MKRRSEPWLRAPLSQPSSSLEKKGSTVVQGRSETQEGDTWQFRGAMAARQPLRAKPKTATQWSVWALHGKRRGKTGTAASGSQ